MTVTDDQTLGEIFDHAIAEFRVYEADWGVHRADWITAPGESWHSFSKPGMSPLLSPSRWLGHHRASFTLDTYVHLLDEELPEGLDVQDVTVEPVPEAVAAIQGAF